MYARVILKCIGAEFSLYIPKRKMFGALFAIMQRRPFDLFCFPRISFFPCFTINGGKKTGTISVVVLYLSVIRFASNSTPLIYHNSKTNLKHGKSHSWHLRCVCVCQTNPTVRKVGIVDFQAFFRNARLNAIKTHLHAHGLCTFI